MTRVNQYHDLYKCALINHEFTGSARFVLRTFYVHIRTCLLCLLALRSKAEDSIQTNLSQSTEILSRFCFSLRFWIGTRVRSGTYLVDMIESDRASSGTPSVPHLDRQGERTDGCKMAEINSCSHKIFYHITGTCRSDGSEDDFWGDCTTILQLSKLLILLHMLTPDIVLFHTSRWMAQSVG